MGKSRRFHSVWKFAYGVSICAILASSMESHAHTRSPLPSYSPASLSFENGHFQWGPSTPTTCVIGNSYAPGSTCTMAVSFAPQSAGSLTGNLTLAGNAVSSSQAISLSGTGLAQPAPAIPTGGLISNFTSAKYNLFQIDGIDYNVLTVNKSYSLEQVDSHTLRFEIRQGDSVWCCNNETSEVQRETKWHPGTPMTIEYQFMLEPGATSTASWFVAGEMHNDDSAWPQGTSPPFAFQIAPGDYLQVVARYVNSGGNPINGSPDLKMLTLWTQSTNIVRGRWYDIKIQANVSNTGGGYLHVWVNGTQVVSYNGTLGYGYDTYWMYGLYRRTSPQDAAAQYRNMTVN